VIIKRKFQKQFIRKPSNFPTPYENNFLFQSHSVTAPKKNTHFKYIFLFQMNKLLDKQYIKLYNFTPAASVRETLTLEQGSTLLPSWKWKNPGSKEWQMVDGSCTTNDELIVMQMRLASNQQPATRTKCESPTPDFGLEYGCSSSSDHKFIGSLPRATRKREAA